MGYKGGQLDKEIIAKVGVPSVLRDLRTPGTPDHYGGRNGGPHPPAGFIERSGLWVPEELVRNQEQVAYGQRQHPRGIGYDLGAVTRMRMVAQEHPEWAATSWTSLGVWGVEYFVDDADTCVLSNGRASLATTASAVTRHRNQSVHAETCVYSPDPYCRDLQTVPPVMAFAMAFRSLAGGQHRWPVPQGTDLSDDDLRAVQLIDAVSTTFGVSPRQWPDACHYLLSTRRLRRLAAMCDQGAESPTETVMRLMAAQIEPGLVSQLVVLADGTVADPVHVDGLLPGKIASGQSGRIVARLDLGHPELKLALQYDGAGHMTASRRDRDSKVNADLANLGWHVVRITYGHLRNPDLFATTLRDAVAYCRRRMTR